MRGEDGRMNIIVFIKQIPDTDKVRLDEHGNLLREGVESIINPVDKNAIEAGLRLRDEHGGKVTAVTMGPPQAAEVLNRALFMGCDDVVLLSDRAFGGADTLATGYTLAMAAKKLGGADLLIFGNRAADAETAQTGPVTAGFLGLPLVTSISELSVEDGWAVCTREFALGVEKCRVRLPAVITVKPELNTPRFQTPANVIAGLKKAAQGLGQRRAGQRQLQNRRVRLALAHQARGGAPGPLHGHRGHRRQQRGNGRRACRSPGRGAPYINGGSGNEQGYMGICRNSGRPAQRDRA